MSRNSSRAVLLVHCIKQKNDYAFFFLKFSSDIINNQLFYCLLFSLEKCVNTWVQVALPHQFWRVIDEDCKPQSLYWIWSCFLLQENVFPWVGIELLLCIAAPFCQKLVQRLVEQTSLLTDQKYWLIYPKLNIFRKHTHREFHVIQQIKKETS